MSSGLPASSKHYGLALGDLDNDGLLDLAAGSGDGAGISVFRDSGISDTLEGWNAIASPATSGYYQDLDTGDLNCDGYVDIVAASEGDGLRLWTGDGGNTWVEIAAWTDPDLPNSGSYGGVAMGEIEHNGYPDVVAASDEDKGLRVWLFRDVSAWIEASTGLPSSGAYLDVYLGDLDDDGYLDIVTVGKSVGVRAFTAEDFGTLTPWWATASVGLPDDVTFYAVALGDLNNDGHPDIVAGGDGSGVGIWQGDGAGSWTSRTAPTVTGSWSGVALGDVNRDGKLDVAASGGLGVRVWGGDGAFGWTPLASPAASGSYASVDLGDVDNDGHLDVAAGRGTSLGLQVWRGDGGRAWTSYSTYLPTEGAYPGVALAEIDRDGVLDLAGAHYGAGSVHAWTGAEGAPPSGWDNFAPTGWVSASQSVDCSIQVQDTGSGLDVSTARYRYLGAGGTWSDWQAASCTGADGTTAPQTLSAAKVPFGQDSGPYPDHEGNRVQFQIRDMAGNTGVSPQQKVTIDTMPPENPTSFPDSSHWPGGPCEDVDEVWVDWTGASDATSGLDGYSYVFAPAWELPDTAVDTWMSQATSDPLPDGHWYISVRTRDEAGNWAPDAAYEGPFCVDTGPPTNPTGIASSPHAGVWVNINEIQVTWWGAEDAGSGVYGYSHAWSHSTASVPDDTVDTTGTSATSLPLADSDSWYFHVRARDAAGNWASGATHSDRFYIDTTDPLAWINLSSHETNTNPFTVRWNGWDGGSGVASYDVQVLNGGVDWQPWLSETTSLSASFAGEAAETYSFHVRARDQAGHIGAWSAPFDVTVGVDVMVRVQDEWGTPLGEAVLYLNGAEQGSTAPDGTLAVAHVVEGDQMAARYLVEEHAAAKGAHEWPYGSDWSYRTYLTNVDFGDEGYPTMHNVSDTWVTQVLVVRRDNTLIGFHLLVSVEWDADAETLDSIAHSFLKNTRPGQVDGVSELLFDLSDGQMYFEAIEVMDNEANWADADVKIYASNLVWPNANVGGIWERAGSDVELPRSFLGLPWDGPITVRMLAHEFGHYGFDLRDEYKDARGVEDGGCTLDRATTPTDEVACHMYDNASEMCNSMGVHPHNVDTLQHAVHLEPCWNTVWRNYRSSTGAWLFERPNERGGVMPGPWGSRFPMGSTRGWWMPTPASARPLSQPGPIPAATRSMPGRVSVVHGTSSAIFQGVTDEHGELEILGAYDGDALWLEAESADGWWIGSETVSCPARTRAAAYTVEPAPFDLSVSAVPRDSASELDIRIRASTALSGAPDLMVLQDGAAWLAPGGARLRGHQRQLHRPGSAGRRPGA